MHVEMQMRFLCLLEQRLRRPMEIVNFSCLLSQPSRNYAKRAKSYKYAADGTRANAITNCIQRGHNKLLLRACQGYLYLY